MCMYVNVYFWDEGPLYMFRTLGVQADARDKRWQMRGTSRLSSVPTPPMHLHSAPCALDWVVLERSRLVGGGV